MTWIYTFGTFSAQNTFQDAVVILITMLLDLIYNEFQLELAGILMLENVNKHQHYLQF